MTWRTPVLAVSHNFAFLHLMQVLLEDVGIRVRTTSDWHQVPLLAAELLADVASLIWRPVAKLCAGLPLKR
jgi:hypothetical protein